MPRFEWDPTKAERNRSRHGVGFEEARTVFDDPLYVIFRDPTHSNGEARYIALGESARGRLLVVMYTDRAEARRLISARKATRKERETYEEDL